MEGNGLLWHRELALGRRVCEKEAQHTKREQELCKICFLQNLEPHQAEHINC